MNENASFIDITGNTLTFGGKTYRCAVGKGGIHAEKIEGDGRTPMGEFALRSCWYRPDRLTRPDTHLPVKPITTADGWCDDVDHAFYNLHVQLPFPARHENLWREDNIYDLVLPLAYNVDPVVPGKGSAIFFHLAKPDYAPTEGCVAIKRENMLEILKALEPSTRMRIRPA